jgi:hypothetical protein
MLFLVILDYLTSLNSMITYLVDFRTKVLSIPFQTIYRVDGLRLEDEQYIASLEPLTYTEAVDFCRKKNSSPFIIKRHLDLRKIFEHFDITEVWTSIHRHPTLKTLIDQDGYAPELETELDEISIVNITLNTMIDTTFRVTLQKNEMLGLQVTQFTEKRFVLCQTWLAFPYRIKDLEKLEVLSQTMGSLVQETEDRIHSVIRQTESKLATLPKVISVEANQENDVFDKQTEIDVKISSSKENFARILSNLKLITDVADVTNTMGRLVGQLMNIRYIVEFIVEPLNFPLGLITRSYHPHVDTGIQREYKMTDNLTTPAVLFYYNRTTLILKVGAEQSNMQTDGLENKWKSYIMEKIFTKNNFYTVTLVDIVLIASSSFVSMLALIGIIINCCNIRNQAKKQQKQNLLYGQFLGMGTRFPRMNKIVASKPHVSIEETTVSNDNPIKESFFGKVGKVNKRKVHDIGLPTTLPYFPQEQTPVVKRVRYRDLSDVPSHLLDSQLSL